MALTRAFLKSMSLTEEQVTAIIEEHVNSTDALKAQKAEVEKELAALREKGDGGWQKKYEDEHKAFEDYKAEQSKAQETAAKETAYRKLLADAGVTSAISELIVKANGKEIAELKLKGGAIENAADLTKNIQEQYKDYIKTEQSQGADTKTPPDTSGGDGFSKLSLSEKMEYANAHPNAESVKAWLKS